MLHIYSSIKEPGTWRSVYIGPISLIETTSGFNTLWKVFLRSLGSILIAIETHGRYDYS